MKTKNQILMESELGRLDKEDLEVLKCVNEFDEISEKIGRLL